MRKIIYIFILLLLLQNCSKKEVETTFDVPADYKSWETPAGEILTYPVPGHGKSARIIYVNKKAFDFKIEQDGNRKKYTYPEGSVFIKERYNNEDEIGQKPPQLTIMVKDSKSPESVDGWIYLMQPPGGKPGIVKSKMCVGCHTAANESHPYFDENKESNFRDYIFVSLKK